MFSPLAKEKPCRAQHQGDRTPGLEHLTQDGISAWCPSVQMLAAVAQGQASPEGISCANKALQDLCTSSHPNQGKSFHSAPTFSQKPRQDVPSPALAEMGTITLTTPRKRSQHRARGGICRVSAGIYPWRDQRGESQQMSPQAVSSACRFKGTATTPSPRATPGVTQQLWQENLGG